MLLELEQLLRLLELLNLVGVRLAQTPELGSQCSLVHVVVLVHNKSLSATLGTLTLLAGRAAHLHEHLDLIVRRLELHLHPGDVDTEPIALRPRALVVLDAVTANLVESSLELSLPELSRRALALRLDHDGSQPANLRLSLRRGVHSRGEKLVVLLLQRQALVPGLLEEGLQFERSLELHREALLL